MRNLNLDQLQTLVAIADLGTLAAAAQALHLAPPTVSLHVSELESRLGVPLLVRGRRQATLTAAGEALVEGGRRLLAGADELLVQARLRAEGRAGLVRLAATAGVSTRLLPLALDALARRCPGVAIKLDVLGSAEAMLRLQARSLDLAIVALPQAPAAAIELVPWRTDPMVAFLPAGWKAPARITPPWLAARGWMGFGPGTQMHGLIAGWFGQAGLNPRPRMELNYPAALLSLEAAGQGVALLPLEHPDEAGAGEHIQVRPLSPPLPRQLGLAWRAAQSEDPAIAGVLKTLAGFGNMRTRGRRDPAAGSRSAAFRPARPAGARARSAPRTPASPSR